jgi:hypothetical protein
MEWKCQLLFLTEKYDWCSNDRKILVTPLFFVVRPFLLVSLLYKEVRFLMGLYLISFELAKIQM